MAYCVRDKKTGVVKIWRSIRDGDRIRKEYVAYIGIRPSVDEILEACAEHNATPPRWLPKKDRKGFLLQFEALSQAEEGTREAVHRICEPALNELEAMRRTRLRTKKSIEIAKVQQEIEEHTYGRRRR